MSAQAHEKLLVITDLDGTLLDDNYGWDPALPSLAALRERGFPLILNSSKTVAEMAGLAANLKTDAPFIAENGGVLGIPTQSPLDQHVSTSIQFGGYHLLLPGLSREFILEQTHQLRAEHQFQFLGFADWTPVEIATHTGLSHAEAERARHRWATEPILWNDTEERWRRFTDLLEPHGIRALRGGRFIHLMGAADKAGGLRQVRDLYQDTYPDVRWRTVALGDSDNDLAMLNAADTGVVIPDAQGKWLALNSPRVIRAPHPGPLGWQCAMAEILSEFK